MHLYRLISRQRIGIDALITCRASAIRQLPCVVVVDTRGDIAPSCYRSLATLYYNEPASQLLSNHYLPRTLAESHVGPICLAQLPKVKAIL